MVSGSEGEDEGEDEDESQRGGWEWMEWGRINETPIRPARRHRVDGTTRSGNTTVGF